MLLIIVRVNLFLLSESSKTSNKGQIVKIRKISFKISSLTFFFTILTLIFFYSETVQSVQNFPLGTPLPLENPSPEKGVSLKEFLESGAPEAIPKIEEEAVNDTKVISGKMPHGSNFFLILKKHGFEKNELFELTQSIKKVHDISSIPGGTPYQLRFQGDEFLELRYEIQNELTVTASRNGEKYRVDIEPIDYQTETVVKESLIDDNLYNTIVRMEESPALVSEIEGIFAWDINFLKDLRKGDRLRFVLEKNYRDGKFIKYGPILGAEFVNQGKKTTAIYFPEEEDYFSPEGKSLRKQFLKAPLKYSKVSSGFNHKRFHPTLKKNVPHLSVDYAAPMGTPVYAVADGKVSFAGPSGPSGKLIRIKHNSVYATAYCHLSGFAKGIKVGSVIKQGQFIGNVGMTGRTTGPHLCFHLRKNGEAINPLEFKTPMAKPIPKGQLEAFAQVKKEIMERLASFTNDDSLRDPRNDT